ncbi:T9SS type A sorting domain-containing protein [Soonwooa sp.]|uniref:T9SS type A sorting domain-containing protein n=1 Tax=Soonwooa sp. TaxID=1938592 RepID=UPI002614E17C|nr:T9SS type A sorting domain-containing protein [Soonwooa sp.]
MKKFYVLATLSVASLAFSQNAISFEASEGFTLGNINGQNGWEVTEGRDGFLTNQIITNEKASSGNFSFKNAHVSEYQDQWMPIMGAEKTFAAPLDFNDTTISYDFYATQKGGSDFEFAIYAINEEYQDYDTLLAVGFENRGMIYIWNENFGQIGYADKTWEPNKWYNMKIHITTDKITYYLDDIKIFENPNESKVNLIGMNFLHNNYAGDAYYDNIKINEKNLATYEAQLSKSLKIYPNPAKDTVSIDSKEAVESYNIFNMAGQKLLSGNSAKDINIQSLTKGNYILQVKTKDNKTQSTKLVKN